MGGNVVVVFVFLYAFDMFLWTAKLFAILQPIRLYNNVSKLMILCQADNGILLLTVRTIKEVHVLAFWWLVFLQIV